MRFIMNFVFERFDINVPNIYAVGKLFENTSFISNLAINLKTFDFFGYEGVIDITTRSRIKIAIENAKQDILSRKDELIFKVINHFDCVLKSVNSTLNKNITYKDILKLKLLE